MSERNRPAVARTHYFSGESLLTADFVCEQHYNMEMLALNNSSLRTWGIANGLEVSWQAGGASSQVTVSAGMAIDRLGRQIVLPNSEVLKLDGAPAGAAVYLTIRYNEVYADYSVESGVAGYKRIVQQPLLEYQRALQEPGINILLAVVNMSSQAGIDRITYGLGAYERRYVGSRLGLLELVTQGSGIQPETGAAMDDPARIAWPGILLKAMKESDGLADYMEVQAHRSQFSGMLTTRDNLGVGVDQPQANLQVERITTKGTGTLTTRGPLLKLQYAIDPPLQPGDRVIPELPVGAAPLKPRYAVIQSVSDPRTYNLAEAFQEDLLLPCRYSYVRMTLVQFTAGDLGELFRIDGDGTVGLGVQSAVQSGQAGPAALKITPDRRVGIALDTDTAPSATLDINGNMMCRGVVTAQSFEGNGSKLQNLPILSYWTKQNVSSPYSSIYYNDGNVGVRMTDPAASLSVGTGPGFIGMGSVTADAADTDNTTLTGNQTVFKSQLRLGDSIVLGRLMPQWRQVKTIKGKHELELAEQFPTILQQSAFQYASSDSQAVPGAAQLTTPPKTGSNAATDAAPATQPGTGLLSSNGTAIKGDDKTDFTQQLKEGDWIVIAAFEPDTTPGNQNQWLVQKVISDTQVQVMNPEKTPIPANISAYMVVPSLIGAFQCNADSGISPMPPPAMLMVNNGIGKPAPKSNTIAINLPLDQVDHTYALQVNGDVNFSGSSSFTDLVTDTLTVRKWASIASDGKSDTVLTAGLKDQPPVLSVTPSQVVLGQGSGSSLLEIGGNAHATGNVLADGQLSGQSLSMGPSGNPYVMIYPNGAVSLFGASVLIKSGQFQTGQIAPQNPFTWLDTGAKALTDGYLVASFGPLFPSNDTPYFSGWLICNTPSGTYWSTGGVFSFNYNNGTWSNAILGSLCVPVQKGQAWQLQIQLGASINCVLYANIYWVPLGVNSPAQTAGSLQDLSVRLTENALPYSGSASPSIRPG